MPPEFVIFLDENHCNTPHLLLTLAEANVRVERHRDHFQRGTPDTDWLPFVGDKGWSLLTTDKKIRYRHLERAAVRRYKVRMFCFASNAEPDVMARALRRALPRMQTLSQRQAPPFIATVSMAGDMHLRELFGADALT